MNFKKQARILTQLVMTQHSQLLLLILALRESESRIEAMRAQNRFLFLLVLVSAIRQLLM